MHIRLWPLLCLLVCAMLSSTLARAAEPQPPGLPPELSKGLALSGLALKSFGLYAKLVDKDSSPALVTLNAEQPFVMASTTKVVTSLAALDLLGPDYPRRTRRFATGP